MKININDTEYEVVIIKKNNKNTYIRVKENNVIQVTTSYFTSKKSILKMLNDNTDYIVKMSKKINKQTSENEIYYLGNKYDVIVLKIDEVSFVGNKIYVESISKLNKFLKKEMEKLFIERLNYWYDLFEENIPYPILKIRNMKTRWGVCNRRTNTVTLNSQLLKYNTRCLDYVIVHELSHFIHFNHSKDFWDLVSKYYPEYKKIRKELRD